MRISDWSSDVCSSDLFETRCMGLIGNFSISATPRLNRFRDDGLAATIIDMDVPNDLFAAPAQLRQRDRKSVVEGKSVSVRVDLGGRRIIKTQKNKESSGNTCI